MFLFLIKRWKDFFGKKSEVKESLVLTWSVVHYRRAFFIKKTFVTIKIQIWFRWSILFPTFSIILINNPCTRIIRDIFFQSRHLLAWSYTINGWSLISQCPKLIFLHNHSLFSNDHFRSHKLTAEVFFVRWSLLCGNLHGLNVQFFREKTMRLGLLRHVVV